MCMYICRTNAIVKSVLQFALLIYIHGTSYMMAAGLEESSIPTGNKRLGFKMGYIGTCRLSWFAHSNPPLTAFLMVLNRFVRYEMAKTMVKLQLACHKHAIFVPYFCLMLYFYPGHFGVPLPRSEVSCEQKIYQSKL